MMIAKGSGEVHIRSMSDEPLAYPPEDRAAVLELLAATDPEGWARLRGLMATLALPRLRGFESRPRMVEIELAGEWIWIDRVELSLVDGMVFSRNFESWIVPIVPIDGAPLHLFRGVPRWRLPERGIAPTTVEDHVDSNARRSR